MAVEKGEDRHSTLLLSNKYPVSWSLNKYESQYKCLSAALPCVRQESGFERGTSKQVSFRLKSNVSEDVRFFLISSGQIVWLLCRLVKLEQLSKQNSGLCTSLGWTEAVALRVERTSLYSLERVFKNFRASISSVQEVSTTWSTFADVLEAD